MAEVPRSVVDATVVTKWHLRDEAFRAQALMVRDDLNADRIQLIAPNFMPHEVSSALLKATRNARRPEQISYAVGRGHVQALNRWPIILIPDQPFKMAAYELASQHDCTFYDGLYLAMAQLYQLPFIYADTRLRSSLRNRISTAIWIEDYQSSPRQGG